MDAEQPIEALRDAISAFLLASDNANQLASALNAAAVHVARHLDQRRSIAGRLSTGTGAEIWQTSNTIWSYVLKQLAGQRSSGDVISEISIIELATALGKFERNLVAGIDAHQAMASDHELTIRAVLFHITSFDRIEDEKYFQMQAVLTQLLSNLISPTGVQDSVTDRVSGKLAIYLSGERRDDIIIRILDSQDARTITAVLHLLCNITRGSRSKCGMVLASPSGIAWLTKLFARMDSWHDVEDSRFELCNRLISHFLSEGLHSRLFGALAMPDEPISPSQAILMKLLDSHLSAMTLEAGVTADLDSYGFLVPVFHLLQAYAVASMRSGADDPHLPRVLEGLHLSCEIFSTIGLLVQARIDSKGSFTSGTGDALLVELRDPRENTGAVKSSIDLLRQLEELAPRTNARKAAAAAKSSGAARPTIPPDQARPIAQLKRILIQLLGILVFDHTEVGDQVREAEGIQLLLGMTEFDVDNPYLREHALFTVRNLMVNNPRNQAIIDQMEPVGVLGQDGEVLPVPDKLKNRSTAR